MCARHSEIAVYRPSIYPTVSFSSYTVKSTGAMMGGYEYTPQAMNDRPNELIPDKQAEAAAVLPRIFIDALWQALVTDPPCVTGGHGSLQDALSPYNVPAFEGWENETDLAYLNPLLMVKDFGATGSIRTDNTFMTNADALFLAKQGLPVSDTNPFTLKSLSAQIDKSEVHIYPLDDFPRCMAEIPSPCHNIGIWC